MFKRVLLFGDDLGLPQLLRYIPTDIVCNIIFAKIRSHQHEAAKKISKDYHIPLMFQPQVNDPEYSVFFKHISSLKPDLIVVNSYSMIIQPEILSLTMGNTINIHGALLPQYRGANPTQWAILNDEFETGVTMHYMTEKIDNGDIIAQKRIPIFFDDTWRDIQSRILIATDSLLGEEIPKILSGNTIRVPQDDKKARYWRRRNPEDGRIDRDMSVREIYNLIRALVKPHPGAYFVDNNDRKIVLDEFLHIPEVTAIKYSILMGKRNVMSNNIELVIINAENLPDIIKFSHDSQLQFLYETNQKHNEKFIDIFDSYPNRNDRIIFGVRDIQNEKIFGLCILQNINYVNGYAEIALLGESIICKDYKYIEIIIQLLLRYAFEELHLHKISVYIANTNGFLQKIHEKLGFTKGSIDLKGKIKNIFEWYVINNGA
jgi:methionyl-tRNA formyltransferase